MRNFTGPGWIRRVVAVPSHLKALRVAGRLLGQAMRAPASAGIGTFGEHFSKLSGAAKLPDIGTYGVSGLLRAFSVVLVDMGRPTLALSEADWVKHLRDMTSDTTAVAFRAVDVRALADAEGMVAVLKAACSRYWVLPGRAVVVRQRLGPQLPILRVLASVARGAARSCCRILARGVGQVVAPTSPRGRGWH